jgi:hypothetical protein
VRKNVSEILTRKGSVRLGLALPLHANASSEESASFYDMSKFIMKSPYRIYIRDKSAGGKIWWIQNTDSGQRESLGTRDKAQALELLLLKNRPHQDAGFHARMARTHLLVSEGKSRWLPCPVFDCWRALRTGNRLRCLQKFKASEAK